VLIRFKDVSLKAGGTVLSVRRSVLGKLFQMVGPHTEKVRWPNCVRVRCTMAARAEVGKLHATL